MKCYSLTQKGESCKVKAIEGMNFCVKHKDNPRRSTDVVVEPEMGEIQVDKLLLEGVLEQIARGNPSIDTLFWAHGSADVLNITKLVLNGELSVAQGKQLVEAYRTIFNARPVTSHTRFF